MKSNSKTEGKWLLNDQIFCSKWYNQFLKCYQAPSGMQMVSSLSPPTSHPPLIKARSLLCYVAYLLKKCIYLIKKCICLFSLLTILSTRENQGDPHKICQRLVYSIKSQIYTEFRANTQQLNTIMPWINAIWFCSNENKNTIIKNSPWINLSEF